MTALLEKTRREPATKAFVAGPVQVNLLPPEVHAARGLRAIKRWLGLVLAVAVLIGGLGYAYAIMEVGSAKSDLTSAQQETERLQTEQKKYAEVPLVLGQLSAAQLARTVGMAPDILWKARIDAIAATLPEGVSIDTMTFSASGLTTGSNPLQGPSVGELQFTARSLTIPDTAGWSDALDGIPGFADAWVSSVTVTGDEETDRYYTVSATLSVTPDAFSRRFIEEQDAAPADEAASDATTEGEG